MEHKITIRAYNKTDKPELLNILALNVPHFFAESEIEDLNTYLENEVETYFVAELNGELVGAGGINFEDNYKTAKISWDFINPNQQGSGIGSQLLRHRLEILKSVATVETIMVRTSQMAFQFYEKHGFVLKEIQKDYWAKGFDMYKMVYNY